ncbi:MAG TPA: energy transducer TonB [Longimicrobium sp.]|jgi:TonB family protein
MRNASAAALAALALLAACASAGGGAPGSRGDDPFRPCPGQEAAMAAIAGRAPNPDGRRIPPASFTVTTTTTVTPGQAQPAPQPPSLELEVEMQVDAAGRVTATRLRRSSGHFDVDRAITESARQARFDPATEHAFPIPGCAIWTLRSPSR